METAQTPWQRFPCGCGLWHRGYLPQAICTDLTNYSISKGSALIWVVIDWNRGTQIPDWFSWMSQGNKLRRVRGKGDSWQADWCAAPCASSTLKEFKIIFDGGMRLWHGWWYASYIPSFFLFVCRGNNVIPVGFSLRATLGISNLLGVSVKIGFHHSKGGIWLEMETYWFVPRRGVAWCRYASGAFGRGPCVPHPFYQFPTDF